MPGGILGQAITAYRKLEMKTRYHLGWAALAILFSAAISQAQLSTGSLTGVITDPSNAPILGAKVALSNADNGFLLRTETDNTGRFLFRAVPPATYTLTAESAGFQTQARTGIT